MNPSSELPCWYSKWRSNGVKYWIYWPLQLYCSRGYRESRFSTWSNWKRIWYACYHLRVNSQSDRRPLCTSRTRYHRSKMKNWRNTNIWTSWIQVRYHWSKYVRYLWKMTQALSRRKVYGSWKNLGITDGHWSCIPSDGTPMCRDYQM